MTAVSPASGSAAGGTSVTLTGTNFTGASAVSFGGTAASAFTINSATSITATSPAGAAGPVDVTVTNGALTSATAGAGDDFIYVAPPAAPVVTNPIDGAVRSSQTPTISGTAEPGRTLDLFIDNVAVGAPTVDMSGNWSFAASTLSEGPHTVYATARGEFDPSPASNTVTFTIDSIAPEAPVITSPNSGDVIRSVNRVAGTSEPDAFIIVTLTPAGGQPEQRFARADGNGRWITDEPQNAQADGAQGLVRVPRSVGETALTITAVARDRAGSDSPSSAPVNLITDSVVPVEPVVTTPTPGQTFTNGFPTFTGTAEPGSRIDIFVDGQLNGQTDASGTGSWSHTYVDGSGVDGKLNAPALGSGEGPQAGLSSGSHNMFTVSTDLAGNSSTSSTIAFNVVLLVLSPTTLSDGAVASPYSATITATGCGGPCTFALTAGALPAGLNLSSAGVLSGTPTAGGTFNFTVTATDAGAGNATASQAYSLVIAAPTVTSASTLAAGRRGFAYSQTLVGSGGTGPYTFALDSGPLPAGVTLSAAGVVAGTPTVVGSFPIVVRITDSSTGTGPFSGTVNLTLVVNAVAITVTPTTLPSVMAGLPYDRAMAAAGGAGTYSFAVTAGALPSGITLSTAGRISGRSFQVGEASFTVTATDSFGNTGSAALRLTILTRPDPSQDPDVRGLDAAQAEATRRLMSTQMDNFSRRLEQLSDGNGAAPLTMGLNLNTGLTDLGRQADQRTRFGGGRVFGQTQVDPDRAELNAMLWSSTGATGGYTDAAIGSGSPGAFGSTAGGGIGLGGTRSGLNAAATQNGPSPAGGSTPAGGARIWTGGAISIGERDADSGQAEFSVHSSGISMGVDFAVSPDFDLGIGGGVGEENAEIGQADTSVDSSSYVGVLYGSYRPRSGLFIDGIVGFGTLSFDLQRRVTIDNSLVTGERDGTAVFGSIGLGYDQPVAAGRLTAYGRMESMNAELDAYAETGSAFWALSYAERDVESLQGVVGARYVWSAETRDSVWTPSLRLEYRHELADGGTQNLQYADWLTGPTYQIRSTGWDRSEFNLGFGLNVVTTGGWNVSSELGARLSANQAAATLSLAVARKF